MHYNNSQLKCQAIAPNRAQKKKRRKKKIWSFADINKMFFLILIGQQFEYVISDAIRNNNL